MKEFKQTFGSPLQVFNGTAKKTKGGLMKKDFKKTKRGSIVSKKKSKLGSKPNDFMRLKEKARKSNAPMFEYNNKKYFRNKLPTGMVIYSRKKPRGMSGGMGCPVKEKKNGGKSKPCGGMPGGFTLRKKESKASKSKSKSKSKSMKKPKFNKKFVKGKFGKSGKSGKK